MHEIEVKATLRDRDTVLAKLAALGSSFSAPVQEDDTIFVERAGSLAEYNENSAFLRLRVRDGGKTVFTLKYHEHKIARGSDPHSTPLEHEVEVSSRDEMEKVILALGYQEALRLRKSRIKSTYRDWEICVDEVEGLGSFIELEEMAESRERVEQIHQSMLSFLQELGIPAEDLFTKRYDILMLEKQGAH